MPDEPGDRTPPFFKFYPRDWIAATAEMTPVEKSVYFDLLCHSWIHDGIKNDQKVITKVSGLRSQNAKKTLQKVLTKFTLIDERWRNPRLEREREKQLQRQRIASAGGRALSKLRQVK